MAPVTSSLSPSRNLQSRWVWDWIPLVDRYIFVEILGPFIFGVGLFTAVAVSIGVVFDLVRKVTESGLPIRIAVEVFLLRLPTFVVLALPMAMLLASLMAYSRLSGSSELTALRSCGISSYRSIVPALVFSLMVTGLTFVFNESIAPAATFQSQEILRLALESDRPTFRDSNILYEQYESVKQADGDREQMLQRLFYARRYDGQQMKELTILDFSQGELQQIVSAETGVWNATAETWDFYNGTIYGVAADGSYRNIVTFDQHQLNLPRTPLDLAKRRRSPEEMNIAESREYLKVLNQGGNRKRAKKLEVKIAQKWAFPFVCIIFGLIGAALGTVPNQRTTRATGFGISVLIIFSYYLLDFICTAIGVQGTVPPFVAAFIPIAAGLGIGTLLLVRSAR